MGGNAISAVRKLQWVSGQLPALYRKANVKAWNLPFTIHWSGRLWGYVVEITEYSFLCYNGPRAFVELHCQPSSFLPSLNIRWAEASTHRLITTRLTNRVEPLSRSTNPILHCHASHQPQAHLLPPDFHFGSLNPNSRGLTPLKYRLTNLTFSLVIHLP